jgi:hypothetical protein
MARMKSTTVRNAMTTMITKSDISRYVDPLSGIAHQSRRSRSELQQEQQLEIGLAAAWWKIGQRDRRKRVILITSSESRKEKR